jgi:hypothetical protein
MSNDYIPRSYRTFLSWVQNLFDGVAEHAAAWGLNPMSWAQITILIAEYKTALEKAELPNRGKADVLAKNNARKALEKAVRQYVKEYLIANSAISDDDRERIGLPVHDTHPTPIDPPKTIPLSKVKLSSAGVLEWSVVDSKSGKKAKPAGTHGFELAWGIFETVPTDWAQLNHSSFSTRPTLQLSFSGDDRGKIIAYATRWENNKGQKGPWSDIDNTIIP